MHKTLTVVGVCMWLAVIWLISAVLERLLIDRVMTYIYNKHPWVRSWGKRQESSIIILQ